MKVVKIEQPGFADAWISGYDYRGYDHVSTVRSSPVRKHARLMDDTTAEQAAACARRSGDELRGYRVTVEDE